MPEDSRDRDGRAQSEVIGYVIVSAAVIVATGTAAVFGVTALGEVQEATVTNNGERAMQVVAEDLNALVEGQAVGRTTELNLESGSVETGEPVSMRVLVAGGGRLPPGTPPIELVSRTFRPVVYKSDGGTVTYENSLVVREQMGGAVAVTDPLVRLSEARSVVPIAATTPPEPQSVGGGTALVRAALVDSSSRVVTSDVPNTGPDDVRVTVTIELTGLDPEHADVWLRLLNERLTGVPSPRSPDPACRQPTDDTVDCEFETQRVLVSVSEVRYEFQ